MDFRSRGVQTPVTQPAASSVTPGSHNNSKGPKSLLDKGSFALLAGITALIVAIAGLLSLGGIGESKLVDKERYQAVFLNNGQVYFGHIKALNDDFVKLDSIYYLQTNNTGSDASAAADTNVTLVKLGCELHGPYDQMVINGEQVLFWENLQDSSQVVKKIAEYKKSNPKGECSQGTTGTTDQATPEAATQSAPAASTQSTTPTTQKRP
jgi:hypothetical protein